jgi:hypothetical protein
VKNAHWTVLAVVAGCSLPEEAVDRSAPPALEQSAQALIVDNGTNLNGTNLNGTNLNGTNLNGTNLNGTNLNGVTLGGLSVTQVHLVGSELYGMHDGQAISGAGFVGAELQGELDDGSPLTLRIDGVTVSDDPAGDVFLYDVKFKNAPSDWRPICPDGQGGSEAAIPLSGRWDYSQGTATGGSKLADPDRITFACRSGALAKCAEWGYKPWATSASGTPLGNHHQACTRLVRADFCGNGTPYTFDGRHVNLYDDEGVQSDSALWLYEAEWGPGGARCMSLSNRKLAVVPCFLERATLLCVLTQNFNEQSLLMSEIPLLQ